MSTAEAHSDAEDPYAAYKDAVTAVFTTVSSGQLSWLGSTAEDIAAVITKAVTARRPRTRYLINTVARTTVALKHWLPDRVYDTVMRLQYHLPPC